MPRQLTTDTAIRKWTIVKNEETFSCGGRFGLYVRGYLSGRKTFYWRKKTWLKLGDYPDLSFAEARELAIACSKHSKRGVSSSELSQALSNRMNSGGLDRALQDLAFESARPHRVRTYDEVFNEWYQRNSVRLWQYGPTRMRPLSLHQKWVPDEIKCLPIKDVKRQDIFRLIQKMFEEVHASAGKQLGYMARIFEYAINAGYTEANPCPPLKAFEAGARVVKPYGYLPYERMPELWSWIATRSFSPATALAMKTVMLTGHRIGVVVNARWEHVNKETGSWTVPARKASDKTTSGLMKSGREFSVVFPEDFFSDLLEIEDGGPFIFPSPITQGHVTPHATLKGFKAFDQVITNHGFRNSIKTWGRAHGIQDFVMDAYVDHSLTGLDKSYRREDLTVELSQTTAQLYEFLRK